MIPDVDKLVIAFAEDLVRRLQDAVGPNIAQSIFYRYDGKRLQIGSTYAWITVLEDGRPPGKWPPRDAIADWISRNGITSPDITPASLAFLIQRSIGEHGTLLWQRGGNSGVLSNVITKEHIQKNLIEPLRKQMLKSVADILLK